MFGLGLPELILIFLLALVIFGPKNLPEIAKTFGQFFRSFQDAANDIKKDISYHASLDDEKKAIDKEYNRLEEEAKKNGE